MPPCLVSAGVHRPLVEVLQRDVRLDYKNHLAGHTQSKPHPLAIVSLDHTHSKPHPLAIVSLGHTQSKPHPLAIVSLDHTHR